MSRSGYTYDMWDENDSMGTFNCYRANVNRAFNGKNGRAFLQELAEAMDAMPEKRLIANELINPVGEVCAIGAVCKKRNLDVSQVNIEDPEEVAKLVKISKALAAEIEGENDDGPRGETPEGRFMRIRQWVSDRLNKLPL
jgi:hypothetical protein